LIKQFTYLSGIFFILIAFSACEKVIPIDLAYSREAIVIEAIINNNQLPITVLISKTTPYFGTNKSNPVSGAKVSARSEKGKAKYLIEKAPGIYELEKTIALPGIWYYIDVEYDSKTYSAKSYLNEVVNIEEVGISYLDGFGVFDSGYKLNTYITDPENTVNYYKLKYYVNGKPVTEQGGITLYSDHLFNGKPIGLGQRSTVFQETDTVIIELQSIDKAAYDYFLTLENIIGNDIMQTASPANPISNFNNGALGYFSAYTYDRKTVIIKDYINN